MTIDATTASAPLSAAMREGSRAEHEAAEGSAFIGALLSGHVDEAGYLAYLLRLRMVYAALEETGRALREDPHVAAVHDPALDRLAALDADLEHWGVGPAREVDSPAATAYADRIRRSSEWGGLYVAHHYTRYLGDLSGGQAIGRYLDREFRLDGRGVAFYDFAAVPKPKPYKDAYRARLDALPTTAQQRTRIVAEVQRAFTLNRGVFAELGEHLASWRRAGL